MSSEPDRADVPLHLLAKRCLSEISRADFETAFFAQYDALEASLSRDDLLDLLDSITEPEAVARRVLEKAGYEEPITQERVARAEARLGISLPAAYVEHIRNPRRSGGRIRIPTDRCVGLEHYLDRGVWELDRIWGISELSSNSILRSAQLRSEWGLPDDLVLLDGDGHAWVALDASRPGEPPVVFAATDEQRVVELAPTFADFVTSAKWLEP